MEGFFGEAIPDFSLLLEKLQKNNILLIIKMHYLVKEDVQYLNIKNKYKNNPNIIFWDEEKDIYELFEDIDIGIVDYSSIYYDLLASGVTKFIRYIYDYEKYISNRNLIENYDENTSGIISNDFNELLDALDNIRCYEEDDDNLKHLKEKFWSYDKGSFDK